MINTALLICFLGVAAFISGCTKDPVNNLTTSETQVYITDYDSSANFSSYKTFSVSDSVTVINNGYALKELNGADSAYISAAAKSMQQSGYVLVNANQNPDIAVNVSRIYTTTGIITYNDYLGYYGDYYDPYYWGYYGYGYGLPYAINVYDVTEGAMSIDLLDLKNAKANNKIVFLWTGVIRGEGIFDPTTAGVQVQALFAQSPYLKTTN